MDKPQHWPQNPYQARLARVLDHMRVNYAQALDLDDLADIAALSRFHFHRVFKKVFEVSPSQYRKRGPFPIPNLPPKTGASEMYDIDIKTLPDMRVAALEHIGPYPQIAATFNRMAEIFSAAKLWGAVTGPSIGLYYDAPASKPAAELRAHAGMIVAHDAHLPPSLLDLHVAGGRYGVLRLVGPYTGLPAAWDYLYGTWLPASGQELADAPPFELNPNSPMDTAPADLITDICVKLA